LAAALALPVPEGGKVAPQRECGACKNRNFKLGLVQIMGLPS